MKFFRVYHHKQKGYYAAPIGFNGQAAVLMFLWAASNNLWSKALLLFVFVAAMLAIIGYGVLENLELFLYTGIIGLSIVPIWSGMSGNQWVFTSLEKQGFTLVRKIRAKNSQIAIAESRKTSTKTSSRKPVARRTAKTKDEDLPINAMPEWRKKKNSRMLK